MATIVRKRPQPPSNIGKVSTDPGDQGQMIGSKKVGTMTICFNSAKAAQDYAQQLFRERDQRNAEYGFENGKIYKFGPEFTSSDLGLLPDGSGNRCPEPAEADRKQVGQKEEISDYGAGWGDQ
jgi:hypothetical protein